MNHSYDKTHHAGFIGHNSIMMRKIIFVSAILSALLVSSCKDSSDDEDVLGTFEIAIQSNGFMPVNMTVPVNTTVTWTNKDASDHTVTSDDALFDSGNINSGGTYKHQFTNAGTYTYHCNIHPDMTGTVIVQ